MISGHVHSQSELASEANLTTQNPYLPIRQSGLMCLRDVINRQ